MPDDFPNQDDRPVTVDPATTGSPGDFITPGASGGAGGGVESIPPSEQPEIPQAVGEPAGESDDEGQPDAGVPASVNVGDAGVVHGTP